MSVVKTDAGRQFPLSIQALRRIAQPDDIADVVRFLASNDVRWITTIVIVAAQITGQTLCAGWWHEALTCGEVQKSLRAHRRSGWSGCACS